MTLEELRELTVDMDPDTEVLVDGVTPEVMIVFKNGMISFDNDVRIAQEIDEDVIDQVTVIGE